MTRTNTAAGSAFLKTDFRSGWNPNGLRFIEGADPNASLNPPAPNTVTVPVPAQPTVDVTDPAVQALIEKARQQEKDKLYGRLEQLDTFRSQFEESQKTLQELQAAKDAEIAAAAEKARKEAEEAARKQWEENDAKALLQQAQSEWEQKFARIQEEREAERATFEKERTFSALKEYASQAVSDAVKNGEVAPELQHLVAGNTKDEIDASLASVKQTTEALSRSMQEALAAAQQQQVQRRGVAPTGYAAIGPLDSQEQTRTLSPADIQNMPMTEWAKIRASIPGLNQSQSNRGLFG